MHSFRARCRIGGCGEKEEQGFLPPPDQFELFVGIHDQQLGEEETFGGFPGQGSAIAGVGVHGGDMEGKGLRRGVVAQQMGEHPAPGFAHRFMAGALAYDIGQGQLEQIADGDAQMHFASLLHKEAGGIGAFAAGGILFVGLEVGGQDIHGVRVQAGKGEAHPAVFPDLLDVVAEVALQVPPSPGRGFAAVGPFDDVGVVARLLNGPGQIRRLAAAGSPPPGARFRNRWWRRSRKRAGWPGNWDQDRAGRCTRVPWVWGIGPASCLGHRNVCEGKSAHHFTPWLIIGGLPSSSFLNSYRRSLSGEC